MLLRELWSNDIFDAFWYVFNFLSIALVVVFLCMNLTPRFNRYAVFFLTLIPFSAIALAQHYFYDVPSVFLRFRRLHIISFVNSLFQR